MSGHKEITYLSNVKIGDIEISCTKTTAHELANIVLMLLRDKEVRKYLCIIKNDDLKRSLIGVG